MSPQPLHSQPPINNDNPNPSLSSHLFPLITQNPTTGHLQFHKNAMLVEYILDKERNRGREEVREWLLRREREKEDERNQEESAAAAGGEGNANCQFLAGNSAGLGVIPGTPASAGVTTLTGRSTTSSNTTTNQTSIKTPNHNSQNHHATSTDTQSSSKNSNHRISSIDPILFHQDPHLRILSISGSSSSGKKLLCHHLGREAMKTGELMPEKFWIQEQQRRMDMQHDDAATSMEGINLGEQMKEENPSTPSKSDSYPHQNDGLAAEDRNATPTHQTFHQYHKDISRRRGIFFFLVMDPSKELEALLDDKEFYIIDDELEELMEKERGIASPNKNVSDSPSDQSCHQNTHQDETVESVPNGGNNHKSEKPIGKPREMLMILLLRGIRSVATSRTVANLRPKDRQFQSVDSSLTDAVDTSLMQFAHLFSSCTLFNALNYPHFQERDLASFSSLLSMWDQNDRRLTWSSLPQVHHRVPSRAPGSSSTSSRSNSRRSTSKRSSKNKHKRRKRKNNQHHNIAPHNSTRKTSYAIKNRYRLPPLGKKSRAQSEAVPTSHKPREPPQFLSLSWNPTSLAHHQSYFTNRRDELSDFLYVVRDVSQLQPVNGQSYLISALVADPLSNIRRFNAIHMRRVIKSIFPASHIYLNNLKKLQKDSDSEDSDDEDSIRLAAGAKRANLLPSLECNGFKGFQIFSPMHHAPHMHNFREMCRPFKNSLARLKYYIYRNLKVKQFDGWTLSLCGFMHLASFYVDHIHEHSSMPSIADLVSVYDQFLLECVEKKCKVLYGREMDKLHLPVTQKELYAYHHNEVMPLVDELIERETTEFSAGLRATVRQRVRHFIGTIGTETPVNLLHANWETNSKSSALRQKKHPLEPSASKPGTSMGIQQEDEKGQLASLKTEKAAPTVSFDEGNFQNRHRQTPTTQQSIPEQEVVHHSLSDEIPIHSENLSSRESNDVPRSFISIHSLSEAQKYEYRNVVESRSKCRIIYRIYARCVKSLKSYTSIEAYEKDFKKFALEYSNHKDLGPAKDLTFEDFMQRERSKMHLLHNLIQKQVDYENFPHQSLQRYASLNKKLDQISKSYQKIQTHKRQEELKHIQRLDEETKCIRLIMYTENATCEKQKMKCFANRKQLIQCISKNYEEGCFVHSLFFFKSHYGVLLRKYSFPINKEKIIICQSHELRSAIVGVWNEGFKILQSICFDEIKQSWILVVRIQDEPNKPQNCKFVFEYSASDLKHRVSRFCQKGYTLSTIVCGDDMYFAYMYEEQAKFDAVFLTGPHKYVHYRISSFLKDEYAVKATCGDRQGNWFIYAQKVHPAGANPVSAGGTDSTFLSMDYSRDSASQLSTSVNQNTSSGSTPGSNLENYHQWMKTVTYMDQCVEFANDTWRTLQQQISCLGSGSTFLEAF